MVLVGTVTAAPSEGRDAHAVPVVSGCVGLTPHYVRPAKLVVACADENFFLTNLVWSRWGNTQALATGISHQNLCTPDCARGQFRTYPISVRLFRPVTCSRGLRFFTRLSYRYVANKPPRINRTGTLTRNHC